MKLALDDNRLITASRDGSLCFWQVKTSAGAPPERKDLEFSYAGEILITKSELEDKNKLVFTLQQQVDETKTGVSNLKDVNSGEIRIENTNNRFFYYSEIVL